jgi:CRP/FNR family cyclic AMP-dependent transcriptional regulator
MGSFDGDVSMQPSGSSRGFWDLLPPEERRILWSLGRENEYPPGTALCVEGDPATHVFILLDGWVKIRSFSEDGRESVLALRGAGDLVGETAGETTGRRNATMQAVVTVHALIVGYSRFSSFLDTHQGGSHAYRRVMAHRWRDADMMLRIRAVTNGAQRLAGLLLSLAERLGGQAEGVIEIALPLSQDELASLAGTSRATVARALDGWRKRGLIRTGQRRITLTDVAGLRKAAGPALAAPSQG